MHRSLLAVALLGCPIACGEDRILRPIELDLVGLSARAEVLEVGLTDGRRAPPCSALTPAAALALPASSRASWRRAERAPRTLELEPIDAEEVVVTAVALDASGAPFQVGCGRFAYADLERPEQLVTLGMRGG